MENLDAASRQLARNAAYGKHGPGVCTATAAHSKFIAVGTSRGLILLFDHFQVIVSTVTAESLFLFIHVIVSLPISLFFKFLK